MRRPRRVAGHGGLRRSWGSRLRPGCAGVGTPRARWSSPATTSQLLGLQKPRVALCHHALLEKTCTNALRSAALSPFRVKSCDRVMSPDCLSVCRFDVALLGCKPELVPFYRDRCGCASRPTLQAVLPFVCVPSSPTAESIVLFQPVPEQLERPPPPPQVCCCARRGGRGRGGLWPAD